VTRAKASTPLPRQVGDLNALLADAFALGQLGIPVTWY
jgi:hypothetical protein